MDAFKVDNWLATAQRWLFAPRCLLCGERGANGRDLCGNCTEMLPWSGDACRHCAIPLAESGVCGACLQTPPPVSQTHAAFVYGFPLDRLVPRFKFHRDLAAGRLMAGLMAQALAAAPRPQALMPVPLHAARLRQRGYDQALELAKPLARALALPLMADALLRTRATAAQSELDAAARRRNLRGAFAVRAQAQLPDHVALIDDVMTTGATLHAAAKVLRRAGVARVDAWVCARVP
ncbi:ComF family protein [Pseudoxanthomonas wuyuanensis]|uniref:ComF family protein n=1 Tax=Pseudoxanthomonas wuyuanensis TaxID=1073196 RepID=A0A286D8Q8_9GAMM|nr:ComF family protein [Pseudoxanthomonas wuyuanensis]KAF1720265.1 ComF family protein [Pseudoxanthomonas wuyuanensis]SOD54997.1 comF family protein [Pseudoxanthomonas wuyuanensis]